MSNIIIQEAILHGDLIQRIHTALARPAGGVGCGQRISIGLDRRGGDSKKILGAIQSREPLGTSNSELGTTLSKQ